VIVQKNPEDILVTSGKSQKNLVGLAGLFMR
jgi:hypothetical protein